MPTTHSPYLDLNLCAGAGGLAIGLTQAGFAPSYFYDKDAGACATLRQNPQTIPGISEGAIIEGDLTEVDWSPNTGRVRLLAAGAPCQPFSTGGSRKGPNDKRNLFPAILQAVRTLRPRAVLIENVPGLNRGVQVPYLNYILDQLRYPDLSPRRDEDWQDHAQRLRQHSSDRHAPAFYNVKLSVLNAADFGVPQVRHRLFIVATAIDLAEYSFPHPTHSKQSLEFEQSTAIYWERRGVASPSANGRTSATLHSEERLDPWITVRDAIYDLPEPATIADAECNNHWTLPGARSYPGHTGSRLHWPSKALKAGVHGVPGGENMMVQDDGSVQYYTLREMARLQSFPDAHYFPGPRSKVTRQIGNAVPCTLGFCVAQPLRKLFLNNPTSD